MRHYVDPAVALRFTWQQHHVHNIIIPIILLATLWCNVIACEMCILSDVWHIRRPNHISIHKLDYNNQFKYTCLSAVYTLVIFACVEQ
jgi:hypothetical protein